MRRMRKIMKPDFKWVELVGVDEQFVGDEAALVGFETIAANVAEAHAMEQGWTVVGRSKTAVVAAVNGDLFPGDYRHAVEVTVRCRK